MCFEASAIEGGRSFDSRDDILWGGFQFMLSGEREFSLSEKNGKRKIVIISVSIGFGGIY